MEIGTIPDKKFKVIIVKLERRVKELRETGRQRERERQSHRQREKQAPCREPNVGLSPGTPGSCPEPKADTQRLSHPGNPTADLFMKVPQAT